MKYVCFLFLLLCTVNLKAQDTLNTKKHTITWKPFYYQEYIEINKGTDLLVRYASFEYNYNMKKVSLGLNYEADWRIFFKNSSPPNFDYKLALPNTSTGITYSTIKATITKKILYKNKKILNIGTGFCYRKGYEYIFKTISVGNWEELFFEEKNISSSGLILLANRIIPINGRFVFIPEVQLQYYNIAPKFFYTVSTGIGFRFGK